MVKSIVYTISAIILSLAFFIFTDIYLKVQFDEFEGAVTTLYDKTENHTANEEDAKAVRSMWAEKKSKLHIFIPHNDISYVDYWLNEACSLIYLEEYDVALPKLEVVKEICKNLPEGYIIKLENVL
jgi:hypothetical protein